MKPIEARKSPIYHKISLMSDKELFGSMVDIVEFWERGVRGGNSLHNIARETFNYDYQMIVDEILFEIARRFQNLCATGKIQEAGLYLPADFRLEPSCCDKLAATANEECRGGNA